MAYNVKIKFFLLFNEAFYTRIISNKGLMQKGGDINELRFLVRTIKGLSREI